MHTLDQLQRLSVDGSIAEFKHPRRRGTKLPFFIIQSIGVSEVSDESSAAKLWYPKNQAAALLCHAGALLNTDAPRVSRLDRNPQVLYSCASFVHDVKGVEYDLRSLTQHRPEHPGWSFRKLGKTPRLQPGDAVVLTSNRNPDREPEVSARFKSVHWALCVGEQNQTLSVLGVNGDLAVADLEHLVADYSAAELLLAESL